MNRELDAEVAVSVFGWVRSGKDDYCKPLHKPSKDYPGTVIDDWESKGPHDYLYLKEYDKEIYFCGDCAERKSNADLPAYSTDISAAFQVVEKMRESGWKTLISIDGSNVGVGMIHESEAGSHWWELLRVYEQGATVEMQLCRAALSALASKKES